MSIKLQLVIMSRLFLKMINKLLRKTGKRLISRGEKIIVHGRVLDQNCIPISDAVVYVWWANCNRKYSY